MRARTVAPKIALLSTLIIAIHCIKRQNTFQTALSILYISFSDFPPFCTTALNASRTTGVALINYPYNTTFPAPLIPPTIHFIHFTNLYHHTGGTPTLSATRLSHSPNLCRKYNPSFSIHIWNQTEAHSFLETEYP